MSRANHTTDQAKLPIIVRVGLCGNHRRLKGTAQTASTPRRTTQKSGRRTARRSGL